MSHALPASEVNFDIYASKYDSVLKYSPAYNEVLDAALDALAPHVGKDGRAVLGDFGAGTGELTRRLAERYPAAEIVALEMNDGFLDRLRAKVGGRGNVRVVPGDAESYDGGACFDAIVMVHVLNLTKHAAELRAIRSIHRSLKPGGVLVIADIGRKLDMKKHALSSLKAVYSDLGLMRTLRFYSQNRDFFAQNKIFVRGIKHLICIETKSVAPAKP